MDGGKKDGTYFPGVAFFWASPGRHAMFSIISSRLSMGEAKKHERVGAKPA
jgi:hypothetical protein